MLFFDKIIDFVQNKLVPPFEKLARQHHLNAIRNGLLVTVPLTIVGSIAVLIANFPIQAVKDAIAPYSPALLTVNSVTLGIMALVSTFSIGYYSASAYRNEKLNPVVSGVVSIAAFLLATITLDGEFKVDVGLFGTKGLFTGIIVALFTASVLNFFINREIVIKFPDTVPPLVSSSFMSLIPTIVVVLVIWVLHILLKIDINQLLTQVLSPLMVSLGSLPGYLVFMFVRSLLWAVGIHGGSILGVFSPIFLTMIGANIDAFAAGTAIPHITAEGFNYFVFLGGGGATLPLVLMMIRSKEKGFRTLGKLALGPSLFNINEPVVFGVPLVLNPMMIIPYTMANLVLSGGTYILMYFNLIGRPVARVPWTLPPFIVNYFVTGGDFRAVIWAIVGFFIAGAIYYPFFKAMEKERLGIEEGELN